MNVVDYSSGLFFIGVAIAAFAISAHCLRVALLPDWRGAPAALGAIVLGLSLAVATAELLGCIGLLNTPALLVVSSSTALGLRLARPAPLRGAAPPMPPVGRLGLVAALGAALLTTVHWAGPVLQSLDVGIYRQDSTWYHLPFAAWFAQTGSIAGLLQTDPLKVTAWYYPLNSELLHSIGMVVLGNDLLSPLVNFGWMGLALFAAWCIGRPLGLAAATLLGAVVVVDSDMMLVQAGNAPSDIVAIACLLAAIAILVNGQATSDQEMSSASRRLQIDSGPLAVAALAAGLAIGSKVTMLVPIAVLTVGILLVGTRDGSGRRAAIWLGSLATTGGFWYLRNLIHAGNPLPWLNAGPLPGPDQESVYPRAAHSIAEYVANRHAWTEFFFPGFAETLGPLWFVVLFAAFAGIVLGLRRRHSPLIRLLALAGAATLLAHVFNPVSAAGPDGGPYGFASNLRYAAPGIAIGLVLLPLCEARSMARRAIAPAYALPILVAPIASAEWIQPQLPLAIAIGALATLVPIWLLSGPGKRHRALALASLLAVIVATGYLEQRHYFDNRYRADLAPPLDNPGFRASNQWQLIQAWAREQRGMRIGIVGTPAAYGQYVFYGESLDNEVRYLGEPQSHGGLTQIESCQRWRERIDRDRFDAVVITPEDPGSPYPPPQIAWTATDRAAVPVLRVDPAAVFLLASPLNPVTCPTTQANRHPSGLPIPSDVAARTRSARQHVMPRGKRRRRSPPPPERLRHRSSSW
jgi:hypothetical protein